MTPPAPLSAAVRGRVEAVATILDQGVGGMNIAARNADQAVIVIAAVDSNIADADAAQRCSAFSRAARGIEVARAQLRTQGLGDVNAIVVVQGNADKTMFSTGGVTVSSVASLPQALRKIPRAAALDVVALAADAGVHVSRSARRAAKPLANGRVPDPRVQHQGRVTRTR